MSRKMLRVSELSDDDPADRLLHRGAGTLSDAELLAVIIGPRRFGFSIESAQELLGDSLERFRRRVFESATEIAELGSSTATLLAAVTEFSRRLASPSPSDRPFLCSPEHVSAYLLPRIRDYPEERIGVLLFDVRSRLICDREVIRGSLDSAVVSPRDILRHCLLEAASSFVVYHNHPSGSVEPSRDDVHFTQMLGAAAKTVGIRLIDHVIVGSEGTTSLASRGLLAA